MSTSARRNPRHTIKLGAAIRHPKSARIIDAPLIDLSAGGCKFVSAEPLANGTEVLVKIPGLEYWPAKVAWSDRRFVGLEFVKVLSAYVVDHYVRQFGGV